MTRCYICKKEITSKIDEFVCSNCGGVFHEDEIIEWFKDKEKPLCPVCKHDVDPFEVFQLSDEYNIEKDFPDPLELDENDLVQNYRKNTRLNQEAKFTLKGFFKAMLLVGFFFGVFKFIEIIGIIPL